MIKYLVISLLMLFSVPANANQNWYYQINSTNTGFLAKSTVPKEVCDVVIPSIRPGWGARTTGYINGANGSCPAYNLSKPTETAFVGAYYNKYCPVDKLFLDWDKAPVCVATEKPSCPKDSPGTGSWPAGPSGGSYPKDGVINRGGCVAGCMVEVQDVKNCWSTDGKNDFCTWTYLTTGATCSAGDGSIPGGAGTPPDSKRKDVPPINPPTNKCPGGTVQGGVAIDGTPICIGSGSDPKNSPPPAPKIESSKSESTPDGGTKTTDTTTTKNADGSSTTETKTTTTSADGTKTVVITKDTTAATNGKPGTDDSKREDDKYDLCKQNPMLNVCRNSSVSGSCGEITCMGDAIQCATLRAAAAMHCKQKQDEDSLNSSPLKAKGEAAINGTDLDGLPSPKNAQIYKIPGIESQGWLGAGGAFEDVSFVVQGHEIVVPLSKWTGYLVSLRYALMIIASMISFRILGSAILKE